MALAILALLAFVTVAFAMLTSVELGAAHNYRDGERARFLAWSGVEQAKFELRRAAVTPGYPLPWALPDQMNYSTGQFLEFNYYNNTYTGTPPIQVPLDPFEPNPPVAFPYPKAPSFGLTLSPIPNVLIDSGQPTDRHLPWPSGVMGSTYYVDPINPHFHGDYYSIRATDVNACIAINDENGRLPVMLDTLAQIVLSRTGLAGVGAAIAGNRPVGGYQRVDELLGIPQLTNILSATDIQTLFPFLTCVTYRDQKVVVGNQGAGPNLTLQPRAPININTASLPVLVAALNGVGASGEAIDLTTATGIAQQIMTYRCAPTISVDIPGSPLFSGNPQSRRYGFQTWGEFQTFLANLPPPWTLDATLQAAVLANANPNTDLNKFIPDMSMYRSVDKTDLTGSTTEFSFGSGGVYEIESFGVILGPDATIAASARVRSWVRIFQRYVETTQADFEGDRIDPPGTQYVGLRDMSTLPECRNTTDPNASLTGNLVLDLAKTGLYAATYDGQITFNAITQTPVAKPNGTYAGFIDRTVNAKIQSSAAGAAGVVAPMAGSIRTLAAANGQAGPGPMLPTIAGSTAENLASPNFLMGSDLHPLASFVGRAGRALVYDQDASSDPSTGVIYPTHHNVNGPTTVNLSITETITRSGVTIATIPLTMSEEIPGFFYDSCDTQGFELWYKPGRQDATQTLFDWESGPPVVISETTEDILAQGSTTITSSTFAGGYDVDFSPEFHKEKVTVGAQASFQAWLEVEPGDELAYTLHAKLTMSKTPADNGANFQTAYTREWLYTDGSGNPTKVYPGTWHHILFTFVRPPEWPNPNPSPPQSTKNTYFFADGNLMPSLAAEPAWPSEREPQSRLIAKAIANLEGELQTVITEQIQQAAGQYGGTVLQGSTTINGSSLNLDDYRIPTVLPIGENVYVGETASGSQPFFGLIDNVVFQNGSKRFIQPSELQEPATSDGRKFLARFDTYRPSYSTTANAQLAAGTLNPNVNGPNDPEPLAFRKHTPALEWDQPIKIIAFDTTAWKQVVTSEGGVDLGNVFLRFGWCPPPTTGSSAPSLPPLCNSDGTATTWPATAPAGWTDRLQNGAPWNAVSHGFMLPGRGQRAGSVAPTGFLTKATSSGQLTEQYNYAVEILPLSTGDPNQQNGPLMAPVVDDVTIVYMPWATATVIQEEEVVE
jgi:hypothetical protein